MIFITVGSRRYPFERLIKAIDKAVYELGIPKNLVFAQTGPTRYTPVNIQYDHYLDSVNYEEKINGCSILITQASAGTMISGLKKNKKVIAVPRLKKYGENVDDHQTELAALLARKNHLLYVDNMENLKDAISSIDKLSFAPYESGYIKTVSLVDDFIAGYERSKK